MQQCEIHEGKDVNIELLKVTNSTLSEESKPLKSADAICNQWLFASFGNCL